MRRAIVVLSISLASVGALATPAVAQVPGHDHFLTVPGTGAEVQIAPPRCELGDVLQTALERFHANVHTATPTSTGGLSIRASLC